MSIVIDLQKNIISDNVNIKDLLREALLIASKLKLNDFKIWISNELKGYPNQEVPSYRILSGEIKFFNPNQGWQSLPADITGVLNETSYNTFYLDQSIVEIEDLILKKDSESLAFSFSEDFANILRTRLKVNVKFAIFTHTSSVKSIIEQVKTALLEWTIKLEDNQILGDENMSFSNEEKEKAQQTINIENFNGNLSTGNYNQNTTTINNSFDSKVNELIEKIDSLDISDKSKIIQEIEENRDDEGKLRKFLGELMKRGSEIAKAVPTIEKILGMLG